MIDINNLTTAVETTKVVIAFDDDGNPQAWFDIVGKDSPQYRAKAASLRMTGIKRGSAKSKIDTKTDDGAKALDKIIQTNEFELAVSVVTGWHGFSSGGIPIPMNDEALRKVLTAKPTWREKITAKLEAEDDFLPKSSATSANTQGTNTD